MSDVVIQAEGLSKIYRLHARKSHEVLDAFGVLPAWMANYNEHVALDNVNLEIRRGEKVAFIGRNGAGKSTLLKILMGVTKQTTGKLRVESKLNALLEIGTGFHPEFTGRENVLALLAQQGVSGEEADRLLHEIILFSELNEFMDQPVKTYSTGMGMRLMFAASTAIDPEVLVLDEVLGVGDAYFAQKSVERIRELCSAANSTLLLVTHDLYAALQICDRFIWIEKGAVLMDGPGDIVLSYYEASIRNQKDRRLREERIKTLEANTGLNNVIQGQIRCLDGGPIDCELPIAAIQLVVNKEIVNIQLGQASEHESSVILDDQSGNWSETKETDGRLTRSFIPFGSTYHRAGFILTYPGIQRLVQTSEVKMKVEYKDESAVPCILELLPIDGGSFQVDLGNQGDGDWLVFEGLLIRREALRPETKFRSRYGNQGFAVNDVTFLNETGEETQIFSIGGEIVVRLRYTINDNEFDQCPIILLEFMKEGTLRTHRFVLDSQRFSAKRGVAGLLEARTENILFGPGSYLVNLVVMSEGGYTRNMDYFTTNENLLDHHSRSYEIIVEETDNVLLNDVAFVHESQWSLNGNRISSGLTPLLPLNE